MATTEQVPRSNSRLVRHSRFVATSGPTTDEKTVLQTAEGDVVVDETFSVAGEDGALHAITEDITVVEVDDAQK